MIWPENLALSSGYIPIELRFRDGHREIAAMPFEVARISRVVRRHSGELYKIFVDESFHSFFGFDVPTGYLGHSISIGVGSATPTVINLSSLTAGSQNLAGLASAFNADGIGVTTSVVTSASGSRLSLASNTSASLSVTSSVTDGATALAYTATGVSDTLTGSFSIAIGSAAPTVFNLSSLPAADQNLNGLVSAINAAGIGISAGIETNASGSSVALTSETSGVHTVSPRPSPTAPLPWRTLRRAMSTT
jgi:hypothetical protein